MKAHKKVKLCKPVYNQLRDHISGQFLNQLYTQIDGQSHNHIYDILIVDISEQLRGQCMNEIHCHL
jgi:DNA-binding protein Fis